MRRLRARHGGMDWRRPEQSGSKRVLHSHTEQAPPPPVPALGGSSSEGSRSTQGSRTDELCDEAERLVVPSSAGLAREHAQPLRSSPKELGVGSALAAFGDGQGSTIPGGGGGLRAAITGKRRDQRHVAAQRFAELCGTICDEVEAPAIVRIDTRGRRPNEPVAERPGPLVRVLRERPLSTHALTAWLAGRADRYAGRQHSDRRKHRQRRRSRVHGPRIGLVRRAAADAVAAAKR